ncbi:MAG: aldehyde ferredoxin oxidoreductase [Chloroflexi bacterium]|nr:aldehyde ferredoxin oxidoreductase [Chloroflexota bacterium]
MSHGFAGKILHIDLTQGTVRIESLSDEFLRLYPGGKALAAYYLLQEIVPGIDAYSPDNVLVFMIGMLTGSPLATATRFTAAAKSPLTNGYGESEAGGFWGPEVKLAGFDGMVIKGRAAQPVYVYIHDGEVEIRDARHLWGKYTEEVQETLKKEIDDKWIRVLQTSVAGENLVRYACITNELRHFNGRSGMGAVMGSKNLKAIVARGTGKYLDYASNGSGITGLSRTLAKKVRTHPQGFDLYDKGTPGATGTLNTLGILPTRNFIQGAFEQVDNIKWEAYEKEILSARRGCYACAVRCKREATVNDRYQVDPIFGGPEYEAISAMGNNCGIGDLQALAKANELCSRYTLDVISTGATIAFAMECFEHSLLTLVDTGGINLRFGNVAALLTCIDLIAHRRAFGDRLAEGSWRLAQEIGGEALHFAQHVKGQELPMHDPRGKASLALGYAVSENGADHLTAMHDTLLVKPDSLSVQAVKGLGVKPLDARDLGPEKVNNYLIMENLASAEKVIGFCYFGPAPRSFIQMDEVVEAVRAATGWDVAIDDILQMGERATNLARAFNVREGFGREKDSLPPRLFEPLQNGALQGVALDRPVWEAAMTQLYQLKGWDPATAAPTRDRLETLGLGWVADMLETPALS